jgi:hypothetical protein
MLAAGTTGALGAADEDDDEPHPANSSAAGMTPATVTRTAHRTGM